MNNDKIYNVSVLNECFRHLNKNGTEQLSFSLLGRNNKHETPNPVVGFALSNRALNRYKNDGDNISRVCKHRRPHKKMSTELYTDLCKIFGHEKVDIPYLKAMEHQEDVEEKAKGNVDGDVPDGGLWPHNRYCNLWRDGREGNFNPNVSKVSTNSNQDNKYITEIKCSE